MDHLDHLNQENCTDRDRKPSGLESGGEETKWSSGPRGPRGTEPIGLVLKCGKGEESSLV